MAALRGVKVAGNRVTGIGFERVVIASDVVEVGSCFGLISFESNACSLELSSVVSCTALVVGGS